MYRKDLLYCLLYSEGLSSMQSLCRCCLSLFLLAVNRLSAVNSSLNTVTLLACSCVSGLDRTDRPSMNVTTTALQTSSGSAHLTQRNSGSEKRFQRRSISQEKAAADRSGGTSTAQEGCVFTG